MEKILDTTQLVSGVAILLSFLAGYRYGIRNLEEATKSDIKSTEKDSADKNRVSFNRKLSILCTFDHSSTIQINNCHFI